MVWILKGQANIIALTLTEKCTLTQPVFLFRLVNEETKAEYAFIAADTSAFTNRYNQFTITETSDPDTLNGEIELPHAGFYQYHVYEQESNTNLDYTLATGLVEIGRLKVPGEARDVDTYTPGTGNTNISYQPTTI